MEHSKHDILVQSFTLTTKMSTGTSSELWSGEIGGIKFKSEDIPLVACIITSIVLLLLLLVAFLLWKCCLSSKKEKTREAINIETIAKNVPSNQNYSSSFMDLKNPQCSSRVVELIPEHDAPICWLYKNHEFVQVPYGSTGDTQPCSVRNTEIIARPMRPRSHPVVPPTITSLDDYSLPQISEFCAHPCQYASSNILEDCCDEAFTSHNFKTRSLPSCVRHKKSVPRDSTADIYDKVNFSKKRKNRMRNDEAAIIALSKSRSQFFNKDTDTLVDNEAVIVYDERTAL